MTITLLKSRIASSIKQLRLQKNYSQEYVAEVLGKDDYSAYSRVEQGRTELRLEDAFKLASLYKVSMEEIYDPNLREKKIESLPNEQNETTNNVKLQIVLDGSEETLNRQIQLLQSINQILESKE